MRDKINVAVIDTGLTGNFLDKDIEIKKYFSIKQMLIDDFENSGVKISNNVRIKKGEIASHGTLVLNTIKKYAAETPINIYMYDVFDEHDSSSGAVVLEAIRLILEEKVDIIVMSLTCSPDYKSEFEAFISVMVQRNILFVCSSSNEADYNCPADLDFVYGVSGGAVSVNGLYKYSPSAKFQFWSNVQREFVGDLECLQTFCGTSKATAVVAGRLIAYMYQYGRENLLKYLKYSHDEFAEIRQEQEYCRDVDRVLLSDYCLVFDLEEEVCKKYLDVPIPWHQNNINNFVIFMQRLGLEVSIKELNYQEFSTVRDILRTCSIRMNRSLEVE